MTTPSGPGAPAGRHLVDDGPGLADGERGSRGVEVVLHQERLAVSTQRVAVERVRISKRIVTEVRTVEVPVRVEQLVVSREPLDAGEPIPLEPGDRAGDLVLVLHEEVPEVSLRVVAVERVVVARRDVAGRQTVSAVLAAEVADVTTTDVATTP
jgi:uncharacterized protein (TIGR02271 family)